MARPEAMQTKLASSEALLSDAKLRLRETAGADLRYRDLITPCS